MPSTATALAPVASGERDFGRALDAFFEGCKRISNAYMDASFPTLLDDWLLRLQGAFEEAKTVTREPCPKR